MKWLHYRDTLVAIAPNTFGAGSKLPAS